MYLIFHPKPKCTIYLNRDDMLNLCAIVNVV